MDGSPLPTRHGPLPRCGSCGELIGVYEPVLVEGPEGARVTSLAAEPELEIQDLLCRHPACADAMSDGPMSAAS